MQSTTTTTTTASSSAVQSLAPSFLRDVQLALFTMGLVIFCALAVALAWYANALFQNGSYKAVSFFLDFISVSNVGCKYLVWCFRH